MLDNLPLVAKITVWICIAHLWIIVCTLVYVKHEGLTTHKHNNIGNVSVATFPVSQSELVSQILTDPELNFSCLLYTSPSPRDGLLSRMPSSA